MTKQILRKEISRKVNGNKEVVEYEYYRKRNFFNENDIEAIQDLHGDDAECAYDYGIAFDWDGDLCWINIDKFLSWADGWLQEQEKDEKEAGFEKSMHYPNVKRMKKKAEKYKGFDLWF